MSAEARAAPSGVSDAPGDVPAEAAQEAGGETVEINDEAEDTEVKDETVDAEVEPIVVAPSPTMPSAAEVEEHRISHIPYRCWCWPCVIWAEDLENNVVGTRDVPTPSPSLASITGT